MSIFQPVSEEELRTASGGEQAPSGAPPAGRFNPTTL
jgi:hypothetical protein